MPQNRNTGGSGDYGARDNDVSGSQRSFGQNRDQNPNAKERRGDTREDRMGAATSGTSSKELSALKAKIANIEAFLKDKLDYDPKAQYAEEMAGETDQTQTAPWKRGKGRAVNLVRPTTDY